jgi:lysophospholipase L1-like esterase
MTRTRRVLFAAAGALLALSAVEAALRLGGFSYQPIPERIWLGRYKDGIPTGDVIFDRLVPGLFARHRLLLWRPVAGRFPFNGAGLRDDEEVPAIKPHDEVRLLALGDSCTFLGDPPWPERLEARLQPGRSGRVRTLNAAVPAWSSLQGRRYLESEGMRLAPDVVLVYFGWNDHWRATVKPDGEYAPAEAVGRAQEMLSRLRLYQALLRLLKPPHREAVPGPGTDLAAAAAARPFRVPIDDFEANLVAMARRARDGGALPVLITAPSWLDPARPPEYLLAHGFAAREGEPIGVLHARYAEAVRRAAATSGALLVDAAAEFAALPDGGRALLRADGIHLTPEGMDRLAGSVAAALGTAGPLATGAGE